MNKQPNSPVSTLAVYVSRIFHPAAIATLALLFAIYFSGVALLVSIGWVCLFLLVILAPLLIVIAYNVRIGRYTDWDVSVREQRHGIFVLVGSCVAVLLVVLQLVHAPQIMIGTLYSVMGATVISAIINTFLTKVSLHTVAVVGSAAILLIVSAPAALFVSIIALLVAWSRVVLGHHSVGQVIIGGIIAVFCVWFVFSPYRLVWI